jgi:tetratricopeptide (TPR) repeat protein
MKPSLDWPRLPWTWLLIGCAMLAALALNAGPLRAAWRDNLAYLRLDTLLNAGNNTVALQPAATPQDWDTHAPARFAVAYGLGLTELSLHQYAPALNAFQAALAANPQYLGTHALMADAYHDAGDNDHAVEEWRIAQAQMLLLGRGDAATQAGDAQSASAWYLLATRVDPSSAIAFWRLGQAYGATGQPQLALAALETAAHLAPQDASILHALGLAYLQQGALTSAAAAFGRVLALQPDEYYTNLYMAGIELSLGQLDAAETYALKVTRLGPNDPRTHFVLGSVYARRAAWPEAIRELQTAVKLIDPWNRTSASPLSTANKVTYHLQLGQAYQSAEQAALAVAEYQAVLNLDPKNAAASAALKALGGASPS